MTKRRRLPPKVTPRTNAVEVLAVPLELPKQPGNAVGFSPGEAQRIGVKSLVSVLFGWLLTQ